MFINQDYETILTAEYNIVKEKVQRCMNDEFAQCYGKYLDDTKPEKYDGDFDLFESNQVRLTYDALMGFTLWIKQNKELNQEKYLSIPFDLNHFYLTFNIVQRYIFWKDLMWLWLPKTTKIKNAAVEGLRKLKTPEEMRV